MAETMGQRIRRIRLRRNLTQHELADTSGVSRIHIARMELDGNGTRRPNPATVRKLAVALGVDAEWLRTGTKLPIEPPLTVDTQMI